MTNTISNENVEEIFNWSSLCVWHIHIWWIDGSHNSIMIISLLKYLCDVAPLHITVYEKHRNLILPIEKCTFSVHLVWIIMWRGWCSLCIWCFHWSICLIVAGQHLIQSLQFFRDLLNFALCISYQKEMKEKRKSKSGANPSFTFHLTSCDNKSI